MKFKVVQLNIWLGQFLDEIVEFVKKEDADVVCLQEVTRGGSGEFAHGKPRVFEQLLERTDCNGEFAPMWEVKNPVEFEIGIAIISKHKISNVFDKFYFKNKIVREESFKIGIAKPGSIEFPGLLLSAKIEKEGKKIAIATTHFLWSLFPETTDEQIKAAERLVKELHNNEIILTGDFNVTDKSPVYDKLIESGLSDDRPANTVRTLHPTIHKVGKEEIAVDFVFHKGDGLKLESSNVPVVPVSDHLPVVVEYEIQN